MQGKGDEKKQQKTVAKFGDGTHERGKEELSR